MGVQRRGEACDSSAGSSSSTSSAARSSGSSRTSIGNASSHNVSACPATNRSTTRSPHQKLTHMQGILSIRPDGTDPSASYFFRGK